MNDSDFLPDASSRIIDLLRDTFGDKFKEYFDGLPNEDLPEAAFPCVIVQKLDGTIDHGATGQDVMRSRINIHFLLNQADDVNASAGHDVTMKRLRHLVEGRDRTTGEWKAGTALHALRTKISLGGSTLELAADVQYDVTVRPDLPSISEAIIQVLTKETISVPRRD